MRLLVALFLLGLAPEAFAQESGTIAGIVTDAETGESLPGANVIVVGTELGAATNLDGEYRITGVPVGVYTLAFSFAGYDVQEVRNVSVLPGVTTEVLSELHIDYFDGPICGLVYEAPILIRDAFAGRVLLGADLERMPLLR